MTQITPPPIGTISGATGLDTGLKRAATRENLVAAGQQFESVFTSMMLKSMRAAKLAEEAGADGITAHLREDRRHITDADIDALKARLVLMLQLRLAHVAALHVVDVGGRVAQRHRRDPRCDRWR